MTKIRIKQSITNGISHIILLIIFLLIIVGCARTQPEKDIKIGANLALTGNLAVFGIEEINGLNMAIEDINSRGGVIGKELVLIAEDNQGDAKKAVSAMEKMLNVDKVDVVFSGFTHITQAIAPLVENSNKVLVYQSTVADMARGHPLIFRDYFDMYEHGRLLGDYIKNEKPSTFFYIGEEGDVCKNFYNGLNEVLTSKIIVGTERFTPGEKDFKTILLKAKESNAGALVLCSWRSEDRIMKQFDELGMAEIPTYHAIAPIMPSSQSVNDVFLKNKAVSTWYGFAKGTSKPEIKNFISRYNKKYGKTPTPDALYAYDEVNWIAKAIELCNGANAECLSNKLLETTHEGIAGTIKVDNDGVSSRGSMIIKYEETGWNEIITK